MLIYLFVLLLEVKAIVNPYGPTVVSDLTNCVNELIEYNFNTTGLIIFANSKNISTSVARIREELLKNINSRLKYSVEIKSPRGEPGLCIRDDENLGVLHVDQFEAIPLADYFIVVVDNVKDFTLVAGRIVRSRSWNPYARIIVLLFQFSNDNKSNEQIVENMLTCFFRQNVINMVVVVPQANDVRNAIVYGWRPFDPPNYCGYFNETAKNRLLVENICKKGVVKYRKDMFAGKIPENMQGCTLDILTLQRQPFASGDVNDPNIERHFINQLADIYNFKTEYIFAESIRGEKNVSGSWDGALKRLAAKKGHILLGGIFPDPDVHEDFECSITYLADSYTWVVPKAFESPKWMALFIIFKDEVWYCVAAVFFLCVLSWKVFGNLTKETLYHKTFRHCFMNTWISHVGFCAYARPTKGTLRIFYVFFNLYCILFLTGYQTKLIDVLKNPTFDEQLDTIEELVTSGLSFGGFEELHDLFRNSSDPFDFMLGEKWTDVTNMTEALIDVAVHRNFSVLCSRLELAYLSSTVPELSESSGDFKHFAFEQNTFTISVEMVSLKGFAFMRDFSEILEKFKQMGVSSGVRRYFTHLNLRRKAQLMRYFDEEPGVQPLTLQHLQGGFLALTFGIVGGTFTLFVEIILNIEYVKAKISQCKAAFFKLKAV